MILSLSKLVAFLIMIKRGSMKWKKQDGKMARAW